MKVCPKCHKEYDFEMSFCFDDGSHLETIDLRTGKPVVQTDKTLEFSADAKPSEIKTEVFPPPVPPTVRIAGQTAPPKTEIPPTVQSSFGRSVGIPPPMTAKKSKGGGKKIIFALAIFGFLLLTVGGGGLAYWKLNTDSDRYQVPKQISRAEMELLLKDISPTLLKRLADDPELKKQQVESLKQLLAMANQAVKDGLVDDDMVIALKFIEVSTWATQYDQKINKDKGPMPPFGFITETQINDYWAGTDTSERILDKFRGGLKKIRETEFQEVLRVQIALAKKTTKEEPTEEQIKEVRKQFAQTNIYYREALDKVQTGQLDQEFVRKARLQSKLQQLQFLARLYQEKLTKSVEVTDADIKKYLSEHPELDKTAAQKSKAEEILKRVKNGGDFAALAKEFSDDPGSKDKGGLYLGVTKGQFMPEFEKAALALEPGQIAPGLVETDYGYHIIKLEKKGFGKDSNGKETETYDVRHILFAIMVKDPADPTAREMPLKDFVKQKLEAEKEKRVLNQLIADNQVEVAADFTVPPVTEAQIQEEVKNQQTNSNTTQSK